MANKELIKNCSRRKILSWYCDIKLYSDMEILGFLKGIYMQIYFSSTVKMMFNIYINLYKVPMWSLW